MRTRLLIMVLIAMFAIAVMAAPAAAQHIKTMKASAFPGFCPNPGPTTY